MVSASDLGKLRAPYTDSDTQTLSLPLRMQEETGRETKRGYAGGTG